jgi:2'-5' RNA ligase
MTEEQLYLWAILPPPDLEGRIEAARQEFAGNFQCFKALRPPVHLTLYQPFKTSDMLAGRHIDQLKAWISTQPGFSLALNGFSFFENARSPVVFIDVLPDTALEELNAGLSHKTVELFGLQGGRTRFHPHFTIGYRDIPPGIFPEIKKAYRNRPFSASFEVSSIYFFRHSGLKWELLHTCELGGPFTR